MINPVQSLLASTLQNLIALVGGLVMWYAVDMVCRQAATDSE